MADEQTKRFGFSSDVLPSETFAVVRFRGEEGLSRCYRFELELVAEDAAIDLAAVLAASAAFTAADMALGGWRNLIPFDETARTVLAVGHMLPRELRSTALGGLAVCPSALALRPAGCNGGCCK